MVEENKESAGEVEVHDEDIFELKGAPFPMFILKAPEEEPLKNSIENEESIEKNNQKK